MSALLLCLALAVVILGLGAWLLAAGARAGDRPGDTLISAIGAADGGGVQFTARNPGDQPVLIGATASRPTLRLMLESGTFTRVPRRTDRETLLAGRHTVVCVVSPGETQTVRVPLAVAAGRRAQLVLAIGEPGRLRLVHRAVRIPAAHPVVGPAAAARPAGAAPAPPGVAATGARRPGATRAR